MFVFALNEIPGGIVSIICTVIGAMGALVGGWSTGRAVQDAENKAKKNSFFIYKKLYYRRVLVNSSYSSTSSVKFLTHKLALKIAVAIVKLVGKREKSSKKSESIKSKKQTLTELYLVKVKINIFKGQIVTFFGMIGATTMTLAMQMSSMPVVVLLWYIIVLECLEQIISYRVRKGYFGANRYEALQLLNFINQNKDDEDVTGGGRQVFKAVEVIKQESEYSATGEYAK